MFNQYDTSLGGCLRDGEDEYSTATCPPCSRIDRSQVWDELQLMSTYFCLCRLANTDIHTAYFTIFLTTMATCAHAVCRPVQ